MPVRQVVWRFDKTFGEEELKDCSSCSAELEGWKIPFEVRRDEILLNTGAIKRGSDLVDVFVRQPDSNYVPLDELKYPAEGQLRVQGDLKGNQRSIELLRLFSNRRDGLLGENQSVYIERIR